MSQVITITAAERELLNLIRSAPEGGLPNFQLALCRGHGGRCLFTGDGRGSCSVAIAGGLWS